MYNLIKQCNSGWKITPFAAKLVSNKPCFYQDIFFATRTRVSRKNEKPVTLSVLSVLNRRSTLCVFATGNVGTSWLAVRTLRSDSPLPITECLHATPSVGLRSNWDGPVRCAATFPLSQFKLDLKDGVTTKEIKCEAAQTAAEDLFTNKSHATANVSLLAHLQKFSTATLTLWKFVKRGGKALSLWLM